MANARRLRFAIRTDGPCWVSLMMPTGARDLTFGAKGDALQLWATCDEGAVGETMRRFVVAFTGHTEIPEGAIFVGTVTTLGGGLVWHLFEVKEDG